jgi:hypothetical protein
MAHERRQAPPETTLAAPKLKDALKKASDTELAETNPIKRGRKKNYPQLPRRCEKTPSPGR